MKMSFAPLVQRVTPAVVNVYASRVEKQQRNPFLDDPFFRRFFGGRRRRSRGSACSARSARASSSIPPGFVVTNHHVIEGMTEVKVALSDKREFEAEIVLRDPRTDLAVLKIKGGREVRRRSSSAIPTSSRSATSCSPSAIRSASARP